MSSTFRAIQVSEFGGPEVLVCRTDRTLPAPSATQVVVDLHAAGVNPVDTYIRTGTHAVKPPFPWTPGSDGAGVVAAVGSDVTNLKVGDRVYTAGTLTGTYAERTLCDASRVLPLPDNITFEQGACIFTPCFTAHRALFTVGGGKAGQTVLVHGASGGVGLACVQLAVAAGMRVIGTASSEAGRGEVAALGAHAVFDHSKPGYLDQVRAATSDNGGVDLVVEMLANVNLGNDLTLLKPFGRVAIVGSRGPVEINPRDLMSREATAAGVMLMKMTPAQLQQAHDEMYPAMASGALKLVVGSAFALDAAAEAHKEVIAHTQGTKGNIVLRCRGDGTA